MTTLQTTLTYTMTGAEIVDALNDNLANRLCPDYATKTASYTVTPDDQLLLCDATSGAITLTLPAASTMAGKSVTAMKVDSSGNAVTFDADGSETINGSGTYALSSQYNRAELFCDGSKWLIIHT